MLKSLTLWVVWQARVTLIYRSSPEISRWRGHKYRLTCDFFGGMESYTVQMTSHVESVVILEPVAKTV
ncbi:hypothetical protein ACGFZQ_24065 [Streptomyces sp. NPDC048254]|uniref:hypothetical protein n=1 Tax=Streptomyces sp. NPDC048254 TaxID=3365525 RepID=UPI003715B67A